MRCAIVDADGIVTNVVEYHDDAEDFVPDGRLVPCGDAPVSPGDRWDEKAGFVRAKPPLPPAAEVVRKTRLLEALDLAGKRPAWEAAVAAAKQTTRDYWACEPQIARANPKMHRVAARCAIDFDALVDTAAGI